MKIIYKYEDGLVAMHVENPEGQYLIWTQDLQDKMEKYIKADINNEYTDIIEAATDKDINEYRKSLVPQEITPRQIRLALIQSGVSLWDIDIMIDNLEEPNKSVVKTLREYSLSYERNDEMLIEFAKQLWIDSEQLDWLFILGATL